MRTTTKAAVTAAAALSLILTGCSDKASNGGGGGSGDDGDVQTDIGVTDDTITLAAMVDHSGVFKVLSLAFTAGNQIWADEINENGGICGRDIKIDNYDTGYDVDNAIPLYESLKGSSAGIIQMVGSPILAALKTRLINDKMLTAPGSWASVNLDAPEVMMVGQTYDIEMLNGLSWLMDEGKIKEGDKIGHIYIDSEYGQNGYLGSQAFAEEYGMQVIGAPVAGTDTDMTATMTKFKSEGVTAVAITLAPGGTGSVVVQNVVQGMNVPIIGSNPTFSPTLFSDPVVENGLQYFYMVSSTAPYGTGEKGDFLDEKYKEITQDPPNIGVPQAYVTGLAFQEVLEAACESGDMTRAGIVAAKEEVDEVESDGLSVALDFSTPGAPSSREAFILTPDKTAPDTLKIVKEAFESEAAENYKAPYQE